ncbi:DUF1272 domain-containing protein [Leptolyngbya sp. Heron Island J]|uniref:DUF1272 domain-containing protein n=1 Tax=Leptolyngbya sp. Heron Island J TaxID=1385935 RepID=UPI0008FEE4E2
MFLLDLRPNCECCNKDLPSETHDAMICKYECTFCRDCADNRLNGICPNCLRNLTQRLVRPLAGPAGELAKHLVSTKRVLKGSGCLENNMYSQERLIRAET